MRPTPSTCFVLLLMVFSITRSWTIAQPCPQNLSLGLDDAQNWLEIKDQDNTFRIPLEDIQVFPGGKERIYILLPDILTENQTPVIRWNELVLKKPLNADTNWTGEIDKVSLFPTPCFPGLEAVDFFGGKASDDFKYEVTGNRLTLEGDVTFHVDEVLLTLHLNVQEMEIPKPMISDLDGTIYLKKNGQTETLKIITGEMLYHPQQQTLQVSGTAEGGVVNQVIDFTITGMEGKTGVFPVNEGNEHEDAFYLYKLEGNIQVGLAIKKYALPANQDEEISFFNQLPYDLTDTDFNELILLGEYYSQSILIDPKPKPVTVPLNNTAFEGKSPTIKQLEKINDNPIVQLGTWQNQFLINFENLPIWGIHQSGNLIDDQKYQLLVKNIPLNQETDEISPPLDQRLTFSQVDAINNGFLEIFEKFDQNKDTLQLKTEILALLKENQLAVDASLDDDFESFLVTTVTKFREAEKFAMNGTSKLPVNGLNISRYLPVELSINPSSGNPVERRFQSGNTQILIEYDKDSIQITAENSLQGKQSLKLPSIKNIYDIQQFYAVLSHIPLKQGEKWDLTFFDVRPVPKITYINGNRLERMYLEPNYIHAEIYVEDQLQYNGEESFQVDVKFNGLKNPLFPETLEDDFLGDYYISTSFPHKIFSATYDEGLRLERVVEQ